MKHAYPCGYDFTDVWYFSDWVLIIQYILGATFRGQRYHEHLLLSSFQTPARMHNLASVQHLWRLEQIFDRGTQIASRQQIMTKVCDKERVHTWMHSRSINWNLIFFIDYVKDNRNAMAIKCIYILYMDQVKTARRAIYQKCNNNGKIHYKLNRLLC